MKRYCSKKCCSIITRRYRLGKQTYEKTKRQKAGVFIYDPWENKILLVQSRGMKWGHPKGKIEDTDSSLVDCALREVLEETGLHLNRDELSCEFKYGEALYFMAHRDAVDLPLPPDQGDASGIGWVKPGCIDSLSIEINSHCRLLMSKFLKIERPNLF